MFKKQIKMIKQRKKFKKIFTRNVFFNFLATTVNQSTDGRIIANYGQPDYGQPHNGYPMQDHCRDVGLNRYKGNPHQTRNYTTCIFRRLPITDYQYRWLHIP